MSTLHLIIILNRSLIVIKENCPCFSFCHGAWKTEVGGRDLPSKNKGSGHAHELVAVFNSNWGDMKTVNG